MLHSTQLRFSRRLTSPWLGWDVAGVLECCDFFKRLTKAGIGQLRRSMILLTGAFRQHLKRPKKNTQQDSSKVSNQDGHSLQSCVLLHEMAKQIRDPIQLRYQILKVFFPARDTTSFAVGNALFHLARNPDIWNSWRKTALTVNSQPLTFERLKSLVPFRHVVFETLRLQWR